MLGWSLYPEARGRGFAAEAVKALMRWACPAARSVDSSRCRVAVAESSWCRRPQTIEAERPF
jgi:hypothetical protein